MPEERMCKVTNRSSSGVVYKLPERHIVREFYAGETKVLPYQELMELSVKPGGRYLIYNFLYLEDVKDITNITPEQEYYMKEEDIDKWLKESTLDEFKDALDFAPAGVIDLIKTHSVKLPLNDIEKAEAMRKQLGFNVLQAIRNEQATVEDIAAPSANGRRVQSDESAATQPTRRTTPKYKVVGKDESKGV